MEEFPLVSFRSFSDRELKERFGYRRHSEVTGPVYAEARQKFFELAQWLDEHLPQSRAKSVTLTELETVAMWTNKAISERDPLV